MPDVVPHLFAHFHDRNVHILWRIFVMDEGGHVKFLSCVIYVHVKYSHNLQWLFKLVITSLSLRLSGWLLSMFKPISWRLSESSYRVVCPNQSVGDSNHLHSMSKPMVQDCNFYSRVLWVLLSSQTRQSSHNLINDKKFVALKNLSLVDLIAV